MQVRTKRKAAFPRILLLPAAILLLVGVLVLRSRVGQEAQPEQVLVHDGVDKVWISPCAGIPASLLTAADFTRDGDSVTYSGHDYRVLRGIDVSEYQAGADWQAVRDGGIDFVIIRCGWRGIVEGTLGADAAFHDNLRGALDAGLRVGVYFFSQATTAEEAAEEARYAVALLTDYEIDLPVMFDWERTSRDDARTNAVTNDQLTAMAAAFCDVVREAGYQPGIYFNRQLGYYAYDWSQLSDCARWVADPSDWPDFYYEPDFWQYSFEGYVDGIDIQTDLDLMFIPK